jgi:hypothetical protein
MFKFKTDAMMSDKLITWIAWLKIIHDDLQELLISQREFDEVQAVIKANPKLHKPSSFYSYLIRSYVSHVLMGVRRQIKVHHDSISFARLMKEMIDSPDKLSRAYYCSLYKGSLVENLADKDFNVFADSDSPHISTSFIRNDLNSIREGFKRCEVYADRRIAHWDRREPKDLPTFNELNDCIKLLDQMYVKYHRLFHAQSMQTLLPVRQFEHDAIFREPWIPSDKPINS